MYQKKSSNGCNSYLMQKGVLLAAPFVALVACKMQQNINGNTQSAKQVESQASCSLDAADPFEPNARFPKGSGKGECIDSSYLRPVRMLTETEKKRYPVVADKIYFANTYHYKEFHVAEVNPKAISEVILQLEHFRATLLPNAGAHGQLRLRFSQPINLFSQKNGNVRPTATISELILSYEGIGPKNKTQLQNATMAFDGSSAGIFRVNSMYDFVHDKVVGKSHSVEQWRVETSLQEREELLREWIERSSANGMTSTFSILGSNCINRALQALDEVHAGMWSDVKENLTRPISFYPGFIAQVSQKRGFKLTHLDSIDTDESAKTFFDTAKNGAW